MLAFHIQLQEHIKTVSGKIGFNSFSISNLIHFITKFKTYKHNISLSNINTLDNMHTSNINTLDNRSRYFTSKMMI